MRALSRSLCGLAALLAGLALGAARAQPADPQLIARGAALSALGGCRGCHTARGGAAYAGGGAVSTPFGVVYGTNITPDPATGIGRWTLADFDQAVRRGLRPSGQPLYPAMPFDHYAGLADGDVRALYAFLMTRPAVRAASPPNRLIPPLGFRPLLHLWRALFFHPAPPPAERGAYLVQTLGHCGACHTPHGLFGEEQQDKALAGGWAEGWYAPALNAASPASSAWTEDRLYAYLTTGLDLDHAASAGPMGAVARDLSQAPDADRRAIAAYLAGTMRGSAPLQPPTLDRAAAAASAHPRAAQLFEGACSACHAPGATMMLQGRPGLERGSPLWESDPRDTIKIVLDGLEPPIGESGPFMPAFADSFRDEDLAELMAYLRARYTDKPAWTDLAAAVRKARAAK
jgi:nicotinate dehydrogenase subunit B